MAGFADLVPACNPAYYGGGVRESLSAGTSYRRTWINVTDSVGDPIDFTSVTGTAKVVAEDRTTVILELVFTGGVGTFTLAASEADTAGLFTGDDFVRGVICWWYFTLDDGTDTVQMWMSDNSKFTIRKGA